MADDTRKFYSLILCICYLHYAWSFLFENNPFVEEFTAPVVSEIKFDATNFVFKTTQGLNVANKDEVGIGNLLHKGKKNRVLKDGEVPSLKPGDKASPFRLWTLSGIFEYPNNQLNNKSLIIHYFDPVNSAFLECIWNSDEALIPIIQSDLSTQHLFIPMTDNVQALYGAKWMFHRINVLAKRVLRYRLKQ